MIVVVDTSVLIDHLRGHPQAIKRLVDAVSQGHALWSVTVVRTELLAGMRPSEDQATRSLIHAFQWQDVTVEVADRAGALARRYRKSHQGVDTIDFIVGAATELLGGTLLTQNVKHFPMLKGLRPAY